MVATIDGKTVSGNPGEPVGDLGDDIDHATMRALEDAAQAVMTGAGNLRSTPNLWYPEALYRVVATRSGKMDYQSRFFSDAPEKAFVACPEGVAVPKPFKKLPNDFAVALKILRQEVGVERLLVEGGSDLNGSLLRLDVVDELFLTLAPKIKLGENLPTYAGGAPLSRDQLQNYELIEHHKVGEELFLRYRRLFTR
jgi:riboflavin biosynthesis pyrimidine reductase